MQKEMEAPVKIVHHAFDTWTFNASKAIAQRVEQLEKSVEKWFSRETLVRQKRCQNGTCPFLLNFEEQLDQKCLINKHVVGKKDEWNF